MKISSILNIIIQVPRILLGLIFCLFIYGTVECLIDPIRIAEHSAATIGLLIAVAGLIFVVKFDGRV